MGRYDLFLLFGFIFVLMVRPILIYLNLRRMRQDYHLVAEFEGQLVAQGQGVTLLAGGIWRVGVFMGQIKGGLWLIKLDSGEDLKLDPVTIETIRVYDI
jgi:hypothetical protein